MIRFGAVVAALAALIVMPAYAASSALSPEANATYLANNAKEPGVTVAPSGLQYKIIKSGFGQRPGPTDKVQVYYSGSLINGTVFDSTEPGYPATFTVDQLIPGWTEALEIMREGDHWQLVIPANLAYGARGAGDGAIPPNQTLVFDLELIKVLPPEKHPQADDDDSQ
ncbi:MAG TPA: FKBP-type peptidyl-prolyl cis-trans isomerase [Rhizomicrobium sp.]|nr:FKBP-type peptidyl-prolyl cis-trans isomerase [Rhizomicrobium sp.]